MQNINIITTIAGIVLLFFVIIIEAFFILKMRKNEIDRSLHGIKQIIALKNDLIPLFLETYKNYFPEKKHEFEKMVELRDKTKNQKEDILMENLENMILESQKDKKMKKDVRFLESKQELIEISEYIKKIVNEYNLQVDRFNKKRINPLYFIISKIKKIQKIDKFNFKGFSKILTNRSH